MKFNKKGEVGGGFVVGHLAEILLTIGFLVVLLLIIMYGPSAFNKVLKVLGIW